MSDDDRLQRIENKIDEIFKILDRLTRMEERVQTHQEGMSRLGSRVDMLEGRVHAIEIASAGDRKGVEWQEWLWRAVVVASLGAIFVLK